MKNLTILFADDHSIFREGLLALIRSQEAYSSYKYLEASNGEEALNHMKNEKVDVLFSDINMPEIDGMELTGGPLSLKLNFKKILLQDFSGAIIGNIFGGPLCAAGGGLGHLLVKLLAKQTHNLNKFFK